MRKIGSSGSFLFTEGTDILEKSLDLRMDRHTLNVQNISLSQLPGYRAMGFDFESQLQAAIGNSDQLRMKTTDVRQMRSAGLDASGGLKADLFVKPTEIIGNDGNTVDEDAERAEMMENQILFNATVEYIKRQQSLLKYAMNSGR